MLSLAWGLAGVSLGLAARTAQAACGLERGGIVVSEVWGPQQSPVCLTNDTTLSNVTLLPGTVVQIAPNVTVRVLTLVRAIGTSNAPVVFEGRPGESDGWQGFYFENTVPGSEFDWCVLRGAKNSALRLVRSTPWIRNTVFATNAGPYGGAIYAELTGGELLLTNCTFLGNSAVNDGGAIWANVGAGRLNLARSTFEGNVANPSYQRRHTYGGALQVQGNARILQTRFRGSRVHAYTIYASGGIYALGGALSAGGGQFEIAGCEFLDSACEMSAHGYTPDTSHAFGGAIYLESGTMLLSNTLMAGSWLSAPRWPDPRGSAVYVGAATLQMENCTVVHNQGAAAVHNGSGTLTVRNSILYFNYDDVHQVAGDATITYSDVQGGWVGEGNIDFNPALDVRYRLLAGSPAVDAGDPAPTSNDVFPPGLGVQRNDQGFLGGPGGSLWVEPAQPTPDVFRVETGQLVFWTDRADLRLEHAVEITGPWGTYAGETITLGSKRAVLIQATDPRRFFRLVKVTP